MFYCSNNYRILFKKCTAKLRYWIREFLSERLFLYSYRRIRNAYYYNSQHPLLLFSLFNTNLANGTIETRIFIVGTIVLQWVRLYRLFKDRLWKTLTNRRCYYYYICRKFGWKQFVITSNALQQVHETK
jgi:hypothetical protein